MDGIYYLFTDLQCDRVVYCAHCFRLMHAYFCASAQNHFIYIDKQALETGLCS